jgi:hypothetical protein
MFAFLTFSFTDFTIGLQYLAVLGMLGCLLQMTAACFLGELLAAFCVTVILAFRFLPLFSNIYDNSK